MQMSALFTLGTGLLAVTIYIVTFFVRRIVETAKPDLKKAADENDPNPTYKSGMARWWSKVILPAVPVVTGALLGAFHTPYLFDAPGLEKTSDAMIFGAVVGWFSTMIYKGVRLVIKKNTGVDINPNESVPPAPDAGDDHGPLG